MIVAPGGKEVLEHSLSQVRGDPDHVLQINEGKPVAVTIVLIFESLAFHIPMLKQVETNQKRNSSTINWAIRKSPKQEHVAEGLQEIRGDQPLLSSNQKDLIS